LIFFLHIRWHVRRSLHFNSLSWKQFSRALVFQIFAGVCRRNHQNLHDPAASFYLVTSPFGSQHHSSSFQKVRKLHSASRIFNPAEHFWLIHHTLRQFGFELCESRSKAQNPTSRFYDPSTIHYKDYKFHTTTLHNDCVNLPYLGELPIYENYIPTQRTITCPPRTLPQRSPPPRQPLRLRKQIPQNNKKGKSLPHLQMARSFRVRS
jgi:hypothetical protein